jgi:hypothetical protein
MEERSVQEIVRKAETNYISGNTLLGEHVNFSLKDTVERIFAYLNSKHITGEKDSLGRDKPFFDIVTAAVNIWFRATDLDRKDVTIQPTASDQVATAFVASILLQDWMKRQHFGLFLKTWGRTLAQYGSAVVKFVVKDGKLIPAVIPWSRLIVDPIDFEALPTIEKLYKTPAQLRGIKEYDQEVVEDLIRAIQARKTLNGTTKDNRAEFVPLYEVHGNLPEPLLKDDPQDADDKAWDNYRQQMHVVSYVQNKNGKYQDFTLYKGKEAKNPYLITHLIEEDGRTLAIGAVEHLFDAQWMTNHTMKQWKDQLDLASRLIFQTADKNFANRNVLTQIETGDILVHDTNMPLEPVNNSGHDTANIQAYREAWDSLSKEVTSTPDAMRGTTLPSQTAYRQAALLTQASNSFFEVMTQNKGLYLEEMMREFIIPHLKSQLNHGNEIATILEDHEVQKLDSMYIPREAIRRYNDQAKEQILSGGIPSPFNQPQAEGALKSELAPLGNQRFLSPGDVNWNEALKDLEWKLDIGVTNEQHDKQTIYQTLTTVLQTLASNPMILQDPNAKMVFSKILDSTGIVSPIELTTATAAPQPQPQPQGQPGMPMPQMQQPMPTQSPLAGLQK